MKLGLQLSNFTWQGGEPRLGENLANISRTAEDVGYSSIWVMDHLFQIPQVGPAHLEMLEAYTALGFIAANTKTASLGTMVTGVTYRHPGFLCKQVSTLDVLSGGRAWLGIGAAWFEREHLGLGIPFLIAAVFSGAFMRFLGKFRVHLGRVEKVIGGLLVVAGVFFLTGGVQTVAYWLLETFPVLGQLG